MRIENAPNILTLSRIPLSILAFFAFLYWDKQAGFLLFLIGFITDWLDGKLARKYNCASEFGKLMDPITDKLLVMLAFLALSIKHIIPLWVVILIALREIYFTIFRIIKIKQGNAVIPAGIWGKWKTTIQMITLAIGLFALTWDTPFLFRPTFILSFICLFLTYYSAIFIWRAGV